MRSKLYLSILACIAFFAVHAQKQGRTQLAIQYTAGMPMGSFKNSVSKTSLRGLHATVQHGINDQFSIGVGAGFQDFYQKNARQLFKLTDGSDMSAVRTFSIQTIPILVQGKYQFSPGATVQPYAALGVGGNLISYRDLAGQFSLEDITKFGFAARPELGVYIPFKKEGEAGFTLGAAYNIMPFKSSEVSNLNHIGIQAGVTIPMRR